MPTFFLPFRMMLSKSFNLYFLNCFAAIFFFSGAQALAQKLSYVPVITQTLTVNSETSLNGRPRNYVRVSLPQGTVAYVYRSTVYPKGARGSGAALIDLVKQLAPEQVALGIQLGQLTVDNYDGEVLDLYTFSNTFDADDFVREADRNWGAADRHLNVMSTCYSSRAGLNPEMFFGFRNRNVITGLNVRMEIVALVDSAAQGNHYTYSISNAAGQEVAYQLSRDGINWENFRLAASYLQSPQSEQVSLDIRIYTSLFNFVRYRISPMERYRIVVNNQKFDLVKY